MGKKGTPWTKAQREAKSKAMKAHHARRKAATAPKQEASWWQRLLAVVFGKATG